MTLKELMGDLTRGDGRRLIRKGHSLIHLLEPIVKDVDNNWHMLTEEGCIMYFPESGEGWKEYAEPKKKIEMWKWAYKGIRNRWVETDEYHDKQPIGVAGWVRIEGSKIEVEE